MDTPMPIPTAPPTEPGVIQVHRRPPAWTIPLGIVYIALGALAFLMSITQLITTRWSMTLMRNFPGTQGSLATFEKYALETTVSQAMAMVCGLLVFVAGIFVILKRRRAVPLLMVWAVLKIVTAIGTAWLSGTAQQAQMEMTMAQISAQNTGRGPPPGAMNAIFSLTMVVSVFFTLAWLAALPIFTLIWFRLRGVREYVAGWKR